jgi:carbon storage regulator
MLVLTRKLGEELVIGHHIRLTVVGIRGKKVRLGITAPVEIPVRRRELDPSEARCNWPHSPAADEAPPCSGKAGPPGMGALGLPPALDAAGPGA